MCLIFCPIPTWKILIFNNLATYVPQKSIEIIMHCYAYNSTGDAQYSGRANARMDEVMEKRAELVSTVECSLEQVTDGAIKI